MSYPDVYWRTRSHLQYYLKAVEFAQKYVPQGESVLDVGGRDCEYLLRMKQFNERLSLDIVSYPSIPGLPRLTVDFMKFEAPHRYDLVTCLQVLEHLQEPVPFCRKLFDVGKTVIISVPYKGPEGLEVEHLQHMLDQAKLKEWTGRDPAESAIVEERLIAVYPGTAPIQSVDQSWHRSIIS